MQTEDIQRELNSIWNGWVIKEKLGKGSFGSVYRIERQEFGRVYESALKVVRIPLDDSEITALVNDGMDDLSIRMYLGSVVEDIVNEVALMYKLRGNTNIVSYEDHSVIEHKDSIGWNIYIRMELLTPLFDYVKHRKLTIRDVIRMGLDMCNALEVCQKYNIVHRDIKPENMFVSDLGVFKLGDFGIARQVERTSTNLSKKGTYTYMAPELYKGEECNSSVDIYSLGIVLYRFLNNNRTPFLPPYPQPLRITDKEKANVLRMSGKPVPKPCNADGRLAEIVMKACSYDPKDRYESATLMKEALESIHYNDQEVNIIYPDGDLINRSHEFSSSSMKRKDSSMSGDHTRALFGGAEEEPEEIQYPDQEESMYYLFQTEVSNEKKRQEMIEKAMEDSRKFGESQAVSEAGSAAVTERSSEEKALQEKIKKEQEEERLRQEELKKQEEERRKEEEKRKEEEERRQKEEEKRKKEEELKRKEEERKQKEEEKRKAREEARRKKAEEKAKGQSGSGKKVAAAIAILALLGGVGGYGGYHYYQKSLEREVPVLTNMTLEAAQIKAAGDDESLTVEQSGEEYSNTVEKGNIISQNVEAGTILKKGDVIQVVISKGGLSEVPSVKGKKSTSAKELVTKANLKYKVTEKKYSDKVAKGNVISQDPAAGATVEEFETVSVVVSKGIEQVTIPDLKGKTLTKAKEALKNAKLKFGTSSEEYSDSVAEGNVISQSIAAKKTVDKNSKVNLVVSKGPEPEPEPEPTYSSSSSSRRSSSSRKSSSRKSSSKKKKSSGGGDSISNWDLVN